MILDFAKSRAQIEQKRSLAQHIQRLADIRKEWGPAVASNPTAIAMMLLSREAQDGMG